MYVRTWVLWWCIKGRLILPDGNVYGNVWLFSYLSVNNKSYGEMKEGTYWPGVNEKGSE